MMNSNQHPHLNSIIRSLSLRRQRLPLTGSCTILATGLVFLAACGGGGGGGPSVAGAAIQSEPDTQIASYALGAVGAAFTGGFGNARGQNVRVAVIDGEVDDGHPDLRDAFLRDRSGNAVGRNVKEGHDDTRLVVQRVRQPRADIVETASAQEQQEARSQLDTTFARSISHATHVSGIIAARDNNFGVVGVAPEAKLLPVTLFRDHDNIQYNRYGLGDLRDPGLPDWNRRVAASVNYAASNNVLVINNSWGYNWFPWEIHWRACPDREKYYFRLPNFFREADAVTRQNLHNQIFDANAVAAWERAVAGGAAIVFAAGNDGWNSETGEHKIFSASLFEDDRHREWTDYRDDKWLRYVTTRERRVPVGNTSVVVPANITGLESSYFRTNDNLKGAWLAVVNVDKRHIIRWSSNGCGIARNYCLAAPGTNVRSTLARGDKGDKKDQDGEAEDRRLTGDVNLHDADGYGTYTGTSMAAPVVSGALAVLKSRSPNISARDAIKILLCSATDLDKTPDRPAKSIEECTSKGVEATHANGWAPSEVYGHGLVNLERALQPLGAQQAAAGNARGVAATRDTRVAFSSAFGNAAPSQPLQFGGFDMFGRVFRYKAPLQDQVMPGPRLSGALAMNGPADLRFAGQMGGVTSFIQHSDSVASHLGKGTRIGFAGQRGSATLSMVSRRTGISLSPASMMRRSEEPGHTPIWDGLAPQTRDIIHGETEFRLGRDMIAGAYFSQAVAEGATRRQQAYGVQDFGVSARAGDTGSWISLKFGRLVERDRFLGSKAEGGYALARPTASSYVRLSADRKIAPGVIIGANISRLRSHVDFRHDAFVSDMSLNARSAAAHLTVENAARSGDRLVLQYGEPLAVSGGKMRQTSVMGYDAGGAYKPSVSELDMKVRRRHRMAQIIYRAPLSNGITGFAAAAHHRNWSNHGGLQNNLVMLGLSLRH